MGFWSIRSLDVSNFFRETRKARSKAKLIPRLESQILVHDDRDRTSTFHAETLHRTASPL